MKQHLLLCVDDNTEGLNVLRLLFEARGFQVLCASSGDEGMGLFASHAVDLVVLDYEMPRLKGDVLALLMRVLKPDVPLILYSSFPPRDAPRLVDAVVEKGGRTEYLLAQVSELLKLRGDPGGGPARIA